MEHEHPSNQEESQVSAGALSQIQNKKAVDDNEEEEMT